MSFDSLEAQIPIHPPEAEEYSQRALELSRIAARTCEGSFDLAYGPDPRHVVDVYRPPRGNAHAALPVLFFLHGGGWTNGYKEWMGLLAPAVTAFPAVFVSVSCRLAPAHRYPRPLDDCIRALAWVRAHIAEHGGDPDRIFVGGHSSGGHLTSLAALRTDKLRAQGIPPSVIQACFPVSARFDMVFGNPPPGTTEHRHQSMLFEPGEDATLASPLHLVEGCRVPFLLTYGSHDLPALIDNNGRMRAALGAAGAPVSELVLRDHDHFDTALEIRHAESPWTVSVRRWMSGDLPALP
jgi:acetyl esterase/lipase